MLAAEEERAGLRVKASARALGGAAMGDLADEQALEAVFSEHKFEAVLHFAANIVVPESVANPLKYYSNNTRNTLNLLKMVERHQVPYMVFSSTAAVYGMPEQTVLTEGLPLAPINPYGASKMMSERMMMDLAAARLGLSPEEIRRRNLLGEACAISPLGLRLEPLKRPDKRTGCELSRLFVAIGQDHLPSS